MIKGKSILAIIPARGGSKGVPRKNIRKVAGKPLIAWTIEEAKKSKFIDRLVVSSEDKEIINIARLWGCEAPFVRPAELARDDTPGIEPVLHAIKMLSGYDYVVLLQPTSPLRTVEDIDGCIEKCIGRNASACVSVTKPDKSPYWMYVLDSKDLMNPLIKSNNIPGRRQDLPKVYALNGAVYVGKSDYLIKNKSFLTKETIGYIMPQNRSIDIDSEEDLMFCELLLNSKRNVKDR
ncbi:MAG: hypothetical protein PWP31_322 [Clostridia bacterium]|nr:hypothetical protein [Clostridia bacterium]